MKKEVEILVRAVIQIKGKILVCKKLKKRYYFFPGGHLEFGETIKKALTREIKEELGANIKNKKLSFIGGSEHMFIEDRIRRHEINLAFRILIKKLKIKSKEKHLQFFLLSKKQLNKEKVLPLILTKAILKWFKYKKPFWVN